MKNTKVTIEDRPAVEQPDRPESWYNNGLFVPQDNIPAHCPDPGPDAEHILFVFRVGGITSNGIDMEDLFRYCRGFMTWERMCESIDHLIKETTLICIDGNLKLVKP